MKSSICEEYGMEIPVFAFSHSPDVVIAVSNAGGFGVLGASGMTPEQLEQALQKISRACKDKPYGIDTIIPNSYVGIETGGFDPESLKKHIPEGHVQFVSGLLDEYQVPALDADESTLSTTAGEMISLNGAMQLIDIALSYPIKLLVNALGVFPKEIIDRAHSQNIKVGALVGTVKHALYQKAAGVDLIIAQGYEAGGHTGDIACMSLVPQVVDAVAPIPVLCAGGVASGRQLAAAMALGADGAWTGSIWLMTEEAETHPVVKEKFRMASSSDTLRSRASTGKPARQLRSNWTDAWEDPANPKPLPMPLHSMLIHEARMRIEQDARKGGEGGTNLINYFVSQSVGMLKETKPAAEVLHTMYKEYQEVMGKISSTV